MPKMNKFPANCYFCKEPVPIGAGFLTRKWGQWWSHCRKCYEAKKLGEQSNDNKNK